MSNKNGNFLISSSSLRFNGRHQKNNDFNMLPIFYVTFMSTLNVPFSVSVLLFTSFYFMLLFSFWIFRVIKHHATQIPFFVLGDLVVFILPSLGWFLECLKVDFQWKAKILGNFEDKNRFFPEKFYDLRI